MGDGVIAADLGAGPQVLSRPENGEFGNSTHFVTDDRVETRLRTYAGNATWAAFALMTDGAAESPYHRPTGRLAAAVGTMLCWCQELEPRRFRRVLRHDVGGVLATRTMHDATVAVTSLAPRPGAASERKETFARMRCHDPP